MVEKIQGFSLWAVRGNKGCQIFGLSGRVFGIYFIYVQGSITINGKFENSHAWGNYLPIRKLNPNGFLRSLRKIHGLFDCLYRSRRSEFVFGLIINRWNNSCSDSTLVGNEVCTKLPAFFSSVKYLHRCQIVLTVIS